MASESKEIEIKLPVDKNSFDRLREKLKGMATFVKKSKQTDEYFTPAHRDFTKPISPSVVSEWLRIGNRGGKTILNYKRYFPEDSELKTHCDEFETKVEDEAQLRKIFSELNFRSLGAVEKEREVFDYDYNGQFEISLDSVTGLGNFVEIEAQKIFGDIDKTKKMVEDFAESLGLDVSKNPNMGYIHMFLKAKGLIK